MAHWAVLALCAVAALFDIQGRRIPNWLCAAGFVAGVVWNLRDSFTGAGLAVLVSLPLWMLGAVDSGDVKLMAAVGALTGWTGWLGVFTLCAVINGVWTLILVLRRGRIALRERKPVAPGLLIGATLWLLATR